MKRIKILASFATDALAVLKPIVQIAMVISGTVLVSESRNPTDVLLLWILIVLVWRRS